MGLDMYLSRKIYVGAYWDSRDVQGTVDIAAMGEKLPITLDKISYVEEHVAYWRKANAIHRWFVDEVGNSVDDCRPIWVNTEKLEELVQLCKRVKENHSLAPELLPAQEGFFFGSTEYDEWYFEDIDSTIEQLEETLNDPNHDMWSYVYEASW